MAFSSFVTVSMLLVLILCCTAAPMKPGVPAVAVRTTGDKKLTKAVSREDSAITIDLTKPKDYGKVDLDCLLKALTRPLCSPICCTDGNDSHFRQFCLACV